MKKVYIKNTQAYGGLYCTDTRTGAEVRLMRIIRCDGLDGALPKFWVALDIKNNKYIIVWEGELKDYYYDEEEVKKLKEERERKLIEEMRKRFPKN